MTGRKESRLRRAVPAILCSLFLGSVVQAVALPATAYPRPGRLERVDVSSDGEYLREPCGKYSSVSANGRFVAFSTDAPLVDGDINQEVDIYVRARRRGTTELVSVGLGGASAVGKLGGKEGCKKGGYELTSDPSITPDGRYVAFASDAINLVPGDTNAVKDVFVYDRAEGRMERVSVGSKGEQAGPPYIGLSERPSISANGRYVSFTSGADNLIANDTNTFQDVFVHDRRTGKTRRVSVDSGGRQSEPCPPGPHDLPNLACYLTAGALASSISLNGRYIAFDSRAPDLVSDDTNGIYDVFVHDLKSRRTERVSVASDGTEAQDLQGNRAAGSSGWSGSTITGWRGWNAARVISGNGRYVAFMSTAGNLIPNDTNRHGAANAYLNGGGGDAFVHDRRTGRTERVSIASDGREQNRCLEAAACHIENPGISANGRYVSFKCWGGCELSRDRRRDSAIAVFDRRTGAVEHAPLTDKGADATYPGLPDISPSGRYVSFAPHRWLYEDNGVPASEYAFYLYDRGRGLGAGLGRRRESEEEAEDDRICVIDLCIPSGRGLARGDAHADVNDELSASKGADIIKAQAVYRPQSDDLYLRLDVSEMPAVRGTPVVGDPLIVYGFRIEIENAVYEVRAARTGAGSAIQPAFGLLRCDSGICTEVTRLEGGYGTVGDNVVAALPLSSLGLENGGGISRLTAFTAQGTYFAGDLAILDELEMR